LTITANILMFGIEVHSLNLWRALGAGLLVAGIALVARF
jgi:uncharacterized membrane protein YdcZ (DUF606 family)